MSDRDAFRTNRDAAKAKLHEKRLEVATYTAAEVKVLTETASKVAYELGRKDAGEEMAAAFEAFFPDMHEEGSTCEDCMVIHELAKIMRKRTSLPSGAVSDERSGGSA